MFRCARCGHEIDPDHDHWTALRLQCEKCDRWSSPAFHVACLTENLVTSNPPDFRQALGAIPLKPGMPTATEAIRKVRDEA